MILGVDPGLRTTGLFLLCDGTCLFHKTMTGEAALRKIDDLKTVYRVERAVAEKPKTGIFYMHHDTKSNAPKFEAGRIKIMQNVGMNMGFTDLLVKHCESLGIRTIVRNPGRKNTKWGADYWRSVFHWQGRLPSEHARDAAVLALEWEKWQGWNTTI